VQRLNAVAAFLDRGETHSVGSLTFSSSAGLEFRVEQTKGDRGSRMYELWQVPGVGYSAGTKYEKPMRARSNLEMVGTLTEVQQLTGSEELELLGIVRAEKQEFF